MRDNGLGRNVLHLISSGGIYGAEAVVLSLSRKLVPLNFHSIIACIIDNRQKGIAIVQKARSLHLDVEILKMGNKFSPSIIAKLTKLLRDRKIDILHTHGYKADIIGFLSAKKMKMPLLSTAHGWTQGEVCLRFYYRCDSWFLRFFPTVVAVSEEVRKGLRVRGISPSKIVMIENGVDIERLKEIENRNVALRNEFGLGENYHIIVAVGRLAPEKGFKYLLEAVQMIGEDEQEVKLFIIGEGVLGNDLKSYAERLGIQERVIFTGFRKDVLSFLSLADIVAMPSLTEGIPIALLEAMALGKPVVAARVGGIPMVVSHGETGLLVEPTNPRMLSDAIKKILTDEDMAFKLGMAGRKFVEEKFSAEVMRCKYGKVYERMIEQIGKNQS